MFTLQTLPACDEPFDDVGKVAGFSLRAGAVTRADVNAKSLSGGAGTSAGLQLRKSARR